MSGFGTSPEPSYPYDLSDYRDEVFSYIDKNGLKNVSVIAHSFGARVAVKCELFKPTFNKLGENDTATPVYMGKRYLKKTPEGKLVIMKNAGHFAFIDRPDAFNEEVFAFLTDSAASRCGYKNRIKII